jgi:16S rRNA (guanine(966)-N(2))-methyltransferase RsmD
MYGRRLIKPPKNLPVRPTTDLAKESLFNILNNKIDFNGKSVLDLFAGTGAISFEFISRGCLPVTSVDLNFHCTKFIKSTSESLKMGNHKIIRSEVFRFLKTNRAKYNIIFADPPYAMDRFSELVRVIFDKNMLHENGLLIVEHPREVDFSNEKHFFEKRKYGKVNFSFFVYLADS